MEYWQENVECYQQLRYYCTAENPSGHFEETRVQLKLDEVSDMNIYEYISINWRTKNYRSVTALYCISNNLTKIR